MTFTPILRRYLLDHPAIINFEWDPPRTLGSTTQFTAVAVLSYLLLTLLLSRARLPPVPPYLLRPISAAHSLILLLLSLLMASGTALSLAAAPSPHDAAFCFPPGTPPRGPLFFWAYVFYLSKLLEFGDTALIVLAGPAARRRLTPLHVYHHATVVVMCRVWLDTRQSLFPVALATNSAVHVVMYGYYFLCAAGSRPRWKRAVTDFQIAQFVFSFVVSGRMLYLHFSSSGGSCSGFYGWCFNAAFNASLLALFFDFHAKSYKTRNNKLNHDKPKAT